MLIQSTVYHYSSSLEIASPRFTQPEDFFTYLVFVASVILVSGSLVLELFQKSRICFVFYVSVFFLFFFTQHLAYLPAQPETSWSGSWKWGRLPLHPVQYRIRKIQMVLHAVWDWWDDLWDSRRDSISSRRWLRCPTFYIFNYLLFIIYSHFPISFNSFSNFFIAVAIPHVHNIMLTSPSSLQAFFWATPSSLLVSWAPRPANPVPPAENHILKKGSPISSHSGYDLDLRPG